MTVKETVITYRNYFTQDIELVSALSRLPISMRVRRSVTLLAVHRGRGPNTVLWTPSQVKVQKQYTRSVFQHLLCFRRQNLATRARMHHKVVRHYFQSCQ